MRSQAEAIIACDFFTGDLVDGTKAYVMAVIEHATRRIHILGAAAHPTHAWVTQQVRNLLMDLDESADRIKFLIRDRDVLYPPELEHALSDAGIRTVRSAVRAPRVNAVMERWIGSCRRELLDRTLNWNLRDYAGTCTTTKSITTPTGHTWRWPARHRISRSRPKPPISTPSARENRTEPAV